MSDQDHDDHDEYYEFDDNDEDDHDHHDCNHDHSHGHHHHQKPELKPPSDLATRLVRQWIAEADAVLIAAGAGMSVDSGNNDATPEGFKALWPVMWKRGFRSLYDCIALDVDSNPKLYWGYWGTHLKKMRYEMKPHLGYQALHSMIADKDYFILSSNVDGAFLASGFEESRIYTPQGEFKWLQCQKPCSNAVYESIPYIERAIAATDPETQEVTDENAIPRCPKCNRYLVYNARSGDNFVHHPYEEEQDRFISWVKNHQNKSLIIEIGAGFVSPVVVRFPAESIAEQFKKSKFVRLNLTEPAVPISLHRRALSVAAGAADFLQRTAAVSETSPLNEDQLKQVNDKEVVFTSTGHQQQCLRYFGHFDWERWMGLLRR